MTTRRGKPSARLERVPQTSGFHAVAREGLHFLALVLAGASLLYVAVLLPSRIKTDRLRDRRDALAREKDQLEREVEGLAAEARALDTDPWAIERALRRRLRFLRPGERVLPLARD